MMIYLKRIGKEHLKFATHSASTLFCLVLIVLLRACQKSKLGEIDCIYRMYDVNDIQLGVDFFGLPNMTGYIYWRNFYNRYILTGEHHLNC